MEGQQRSHERKETREVKKSCGRPQLCEVLPVVRRPYEPGAKVVNCGETGSGLDWFEKKFYIHTLSSVFMYTGTSYTACAMNISSNKKGKSISKCYYIIIPRYAFLNVNQI